MKTILVISSLMFAGPVLAKSHNAEAVLSSPTMKDLAVKVQLMPTDKGLKIIAHASGLKPGSVHGLHIHETGKCEAPDFKSAGDHFNPENNQHGGPAAEKHHLGDLGNLVADAKGEAHTEVLIQDKKALKSLIGKSVLIHAKADDLNTQPSGDSGDRIACGIIRSI